MFRKITDQFLASPQIAVSDLPLAVQLGVSLVINNRPEGEADDQTPGADMEAAVRAAGLDYCAIPITHAGFSAAQVEAMKAALEGTQGPVLAYCRSGTRSTLLWALAQASRGEDPDTIAEQAARGGYDITPVRAIVDMLAAKSASGA